MKTEQWEYKITTGITDIRYEGESIETVEKKLNNMGEMGWEAYAVVTFSSGNHSSEIYLKRKIHA